MAQGPPHPGQQVTHGTPHLTSPTPPALHEPWPRWSSKAALTGIGLPSTHLAHLEEQAELLAREAAVLVEELGEEGSSWVEEGRRMMAEGRAHFRALYSWGKRRHQACSMAPTTCRLIKDFHAASRCPKCQARLVVVEGGSSQVGRVGPTNSRLRALLPLTTTTASITVGGSTVHLEQGKLVVIDDSFDSRMVNEGLERLVVLAVDFQHPDLTDRQRKDSYSERGQMQFSIY